MFPARLRWLAVAIAVMLIARPAAAQFKFAYSDDPKDAMELDDVIAIRPNITQRIYFSFYNTGPGRKNVKVSIEQPDAAGKWKEIAKAEVLKIDKEQSVPVNFVDVAPPAKAPAEQWPKLDGPPFKLRFLIDDGVNVPTNKEVRVKIEDARDYINITEASYDEGQGRLLIELKARKPLDPPCPVKLVLHRSAIPGLKPTTTGSVDTKLGKDKMTGKLMAENFEFESFVAPKNSRVFLTVDDVERAFVYHCKFQTGDLKRVDEAMRVRLRAPRYTKPLQDVKVGVEVDVVNQAAAGDDPLQRGQIALSIDSNGDGNFVPIAEQPRGLRSQSIEYKPEGKAFLFKTAVKDHVVSMNTVGISGKAAIKVKLLRGKTDVVPVANEQDEKLALFFPLETDRFAPLRFENDSVIAEMIVDETPAEDLKILDISSKFVRPEQKLTPRLQFKPRADKQAPIAKEKIVFFFGEVDEKTQKPPEKVETYPAVLHQDRKSWVPKDDMVVPEKVGKLFLTAYVETATGVPMSTKETLTIRSAAAAKEGDDAGGDGLATIKGTLTYGDRVQPELEITLAKAKPEKGDPPAKKTTTNDKGEYSFTKVAPGDYVLSAARPDVVAREGVTARKNETHKVDLKLKLRPR